MSLEHTQRHLPLAGSFNVRDVGGYATRDGHHIRWHTLLRADSLHALSPEAQHQLLEYGVRTIIDLRRPQETRSEPNVFERSSAVTYRHLPLFDDLGATTIDAPAETLDELYTRYLDMCQPQLRAILGALAEPDAAPALVHCKVGKDRTGLTIALALGAADVPDETIADDYALSYGYLRPLLETWRANLVADGRDTTRYDRMLRSDRSTMLATLGYLRQRYGGPASYLRMIGLSQAQLDQLRATLVQ